jgi:hypothetical protein
MNRILLGMAAASAIVFVSSAMAIPTISVAFDTDNDGIWDTTVTDNGAGDNAADINYIFAELDSYTKINAGSFAENPFSMLMAIDHKRQTGASGPTKRTYGATVVGLTLADISSAVYAAVGIGGAGGDTVETWGYFNADDTAFGMAELIGTSGPEGFGFTFESSQYNIVDADEFSLTLITTIETFGTHQASVSSTISISEPSALALFGLGLLGLGGAASRRKKA